jgi:hypothetical protein
MNAMDKHDHPRFEIVGAGREATRADCNIA